MTAAQKSTLAGMKNAAALEAYFVSNNTRIHDFKGRQRGAEHPLSGQRRDPRLVPQGGRHPRAGFRAL